MHEEADAVENNQVNRSDPIDATLAIDGGPPARSAPMPPWPHYDEDQIEASVRVLRSGRVNYWTGDECRAFEDEFAAYHGMDHAISLANGTVALELALRVLGIGLGDEVVVTPRSYFASASCVEMVGAIAVFADVDVDSQVITAQSIAAVVTPRTRAIVAVHLAGWPCDMPGIMDLARDRGLVVVEDCAQAVGARIDGRLVGTFGDVSAFSFCQDKIITTGGEGGMLLTNDPGLWASAWSFKDHGKSHAKVHDPSGAPGFRWVHDSFGSNYRMTEVQAAIGRIQLRLLDAWVETRRANAQRLNAGLEGLAALRLTIPPPDVYHAFYKYYAFIRPESLKPGWDRSRVLAALIAEGIPGWSGSCPEIYREVAFAGRAHPVLPIARALGESSVMLPVHPTLGPDDIDDMIAGVRKVIDCASR